MELSKNVQGVVGFQFEPQLSDGEKSPDYDSDTDTGSYSSSSENSQNAEILECQKQESLSCKCGSCSWMPSITEQICCHDIDEIKYFKLGGIKHFATNLLKKSTTSCEYIFLFTSESSCITEHEDFNPIVLLPNALWTAMVIEHTRKNTKLQKREEAVTNKMYRYTAYRQFTGFIHNRLGKGVRRIIPACVVNAIREKFPEQNGIYVGFLGEDDNVSELKDTW